MSQRIELKQLSLESDFEPSMKSLLRMMKVLIENGAEGKTQLSFHSNLNYARLTKHLAWLEQKDLVASTVENNKIVVSLTKTGKAFALLILD